MALVRKSFRNISRSLLFIFGLFILAHAETYVLRKVELTSKPVINKNRVTYTLDLVFYSSPDEFWAYYDSAIGRIIIDMYDCKIEGPEEEVLKNDLFNGLFVKNLNSSMSLSGEHAQVQIPLSKEWHVEAQKFDAQIMRIKFWKYQKSGSLIPKPQKKVLVPVLEVFATAFVLCTMTFIVIVVTSSMLKD
jgi:hypothetical protein